MGGVGMGYGGAFCTLEEKYQKRQKYQAQKLMVQTYVFY